MDTQNTTRTPPEKTYDIVDGLRPNTPQRVTRDLIVAVAAFMGVQLLAAPLGFWRWILGSLAAFLGISLGEVYGWMVNVSDRRRLSHILVQTHTVYMRSMDEASDFLRDKLADFRAEDNLRLRAFEEKVGDLEAVAGQATQARKDANSAAATASKAVETLDVIVGRIEVVETKISKTETAAEQINARLTALLKKAPSKRGVSIAGPDGEIAPAPIEKAPVAKKPVKKAANG